MRGFIQGGGNPKQNECHPIACGTYSACGDGLGSKQRMHSTQRQTTSWDTDTTTVGTQQLEEGEDTVRWVKRKSKKIQPRPKNQMKHKSSSLNKQMNLVKI